MATSKTSSLSRSLIAAAFAAVLSMAPRLAAQAPGTMASYGTGCGTITLTADAAPSVPNGSGGGSWVSLLVSGIPAGTLANFIIYDFVALAPPGIDLSLIGAAGCPLLVATPTLYWGHLGTLATTPNDTFPTNLPWFFFNNGWIGVAVHFQAVSIVPGANPLGLVTSNGLTLIAG